MRLKLATVAKLGTSSAAQVFSSLSNLLIVVAIARAGGEESVGRWAIVFGAYLIAVGFQRSLIWEPALASIGRASASVGLSAALTASLLLGIVPVIVFGAAGSLSQFPEFVALSAVWLFLGVNDSLRYRFFALGSPERVCLMDAVWCLMSLVAWAPIQEHGNVSLAVALWGLGGLAGAVLGISIDSPRLAPVATAMRWWREYGQRLGSALVLETLVYTVSTQGVVLGLAWILSASDLGALRAAQIVVSPAALVLTAANVVLLPYLSHSPKSEGRRIALWASVGLTGTTALLILSTVSLAPVIYRLIFNASISASPGLVISMGLVLVGNAVATGASALLKTEGAARPIVHARLLASLAGIPAVLGGAAAGGIRLAAWGLVVQSAVMAGALVWSGLKRQGYASAPSAKANRSSGP